MSLIDRLSDTEEPHIPVHTFYAALVGLADGQVTRGQIESLFNIGTTGQDKNELDALISGYQAAADKSRYLTAVHSIFMLLEDDGFTLTKQQINSWLSAAEASY